MNVSSFILESLNNTAGIIVAIIAASTAFGIFSYKQNWNKKHKHYQTIIKNVSNISFNVKEMLNAISGDTLYDYHKGVYSDQIHEIKRFTNEIRLELPLARAFISRKSAKLLSEYIDNVDQALVDYEMEIFNDPSADRGPIQTTALKSIDILSDRLIDKLSFSMKRDLRIISFS